MMKSPNFVGIDNKWCHFGYILYIMWRWWCWFYN